jgi:hypothetical protein
VKSSGALMGRAWSSLWMNMWHAMARAAERKVAIRLRRSAQRHSLFHGLRCVCSSTALTCRRTSVRPQKTKSLNAIRLPFRPLKLLPCAQFRMYRTKRALFLKAISFNSAPLTTSRVSSSHRIPHRDHPRAASCADHPVARQTPVVPRAVRAGRQSDRRPEQPVADHGGGHESAHP